MGIQVLGENVQGISGQLNKQSKFLFNTSTTDSTTFRKDYAFSSGYYSVTVSEYASSTNVTLYFVDNTDKIVFTTVRTVDGLSDGVFYLPVAAVAVILRPSQTGTVFSFLQWELETSPTLMLTGSQPWPWSIIPLGTSSNNGYLNGRVQTYKGNTIVAMGVSGGEIQTITGFADTALLDKSASATPLSNGSAFVTDGTGIMISFGSNGNGTQVSFNDGVTWATVTSTNAYLGIQTNNPDQVAYGGGYFAVASNNNSSYPVVKAAASGLTASTVWATSSIFPSGSTISGIVFGTSNFVAYGYSSGLPRVYYSAASSSTWAEATLPANTASLNQAYLTMTFLSGVGHVHALRSTVDNSLIILKSTDDGATWSAQTLTGDVVDQTANAYSLQGLSTANGQLFLSYASRLYVSTNGSEWNYVVDSTTSTSFGQVFYSGSYYYFVRADAKNNGSVWSSAPDDFSVDPGVGI